MDTDETIDQVAARDLLERFCTAVFERRDVAAALRLMSPRFRRLWADDWVVGELESERGYLSWDSRADDGEALATLDTHHPAWSIFAEETLLAWRDMWSAFDDLQVRGADHVAFRRYEAPSPPSGRWTAHPPLAQRPRRLAVDFEEIDHVLYVADVLVQA